VAVTIREVAQAAGVSVATVSRALHGMSVISQKTRDHVSAVALELGYELPTRPEPGIRDRRVAIVLPFLGRWYFAKALEAIERIVREHGYEAVVLRPLDSTGQPMAVADHLEHFSVKGVIIISQPPSETDIAALEKLQLPTILIDISDNRFPHVVIDDVQVGLLATRHLIAQGHSKIALLSGDPHDPKNFSTPNDRRAGYLRAMTQAGLEIRPEFQIFADFTARGADAVVTRLLVQEDIPTAIFAASDEMAMGAMGAARRLGLRVPEDLSIVGVDDHDLAETVGLTTVAQPIETMAEMAAWQLVSQMGNEAKQPSLQKHEMPVTLVVRTSTQSIDSKSSQ